MRDGFLIFCCGILAGFVGAATLSAYVPTSTRNEYINAIAECEKSLPRDQKCKIVGVPIPKDHK